MIPQPGATVALAGGRTLAFDDVGDPHGRPVVYLHGCPGSRLSRHPDDRLAARAGVRLLAVDRPGYGHSDADPHADDASQADDVVALADALGLERFAVFGWSTGGVTALALAAGHPSRVDVCGVAAGQPHLAADPGKQTPAEFARIAAPFLVQPGMSVELAAEAVVEGWSAEAVADLHRVDGLHEQLALSLSNAVHRGLAGVEADLRAMATPWSFDLGSISARVTLWYGSNDEVYGPSIGEDLAARIPTAVLVIVDGATHSLPLTHWQQMLDSLRKEMTCR